MRPPSLLRRTVSLLLGCWLVVFAAEPAALHVCPVHDSGSRATHASHHPSPRQGHQSCSCPGDCCAPSIARLATPPTIEPAGVVAVSDSGIAPAPLIESFGARPVLPPAIGPPARLG